MVTGTLYSSAISSLMVLSIIAYLPLAIAERSQQPSVSSSSCSRVQSRQAKLLLDQYVYSDLRDASFQLDAAICPLAADNDRFAIHEAIKTRAGSAWQCGHCGKQFSSESYVDRHLESHHINTIPTNATQCFADFCDMLGCTDTPISPCRPPDRDRRKLFCKAVINKCLPAEAGALVHRLHDMLISRLCDAIDCTSDGRSLSIANRSTSNARSSSIRWVAITILIIFLLVFYIILWCARHDRGVRKDLTRLASSRRHFWQSERTKTKII